MKTNNQEINRRTFIKSASTCAFCLGTGSIFTGLSRDIFADEYQLNANNELIVDKSVFASADENILIKHTDSKFPISLKSIGDDQYLALSMKCPHQGGKAEWNKDHYVCTTHGARFAETGEVIRGPTTNNLTSFPVNVIDSKIHIKIE
ncbi:MAG: Rieske (2Fe-2S) protein [Pseudomonadota bacterium]